MAGFNLKEESEVKEYLENLSIEYGFGCYHEKKPEVCHLLGDFFEAIKQDYDKAGKLYRVNCDDYKYGHSCFKFGNYTFGGKGGVKEDHVKATAYYDKSCDLKYPEGCLHAGLMRTANASKFTRNDAISLEYFKRGCDLKSAMSCFYVSGMYISGIPNFLEKDMKTAFEFSQKACDLGNVYACSNIAHMYEKGDGCPQDSKLAEKYRKYVDELKEQYTKQFRTITFGEGGI